MVLNQNNKVLLAAKSQTYLLRSIENLLNENEIDTVFSIADVDEISHEGIEFSAIIVYVDENIIADMQFLVFLKDMAAENDILLFLIGYDSDILSIKGTLPSHIIQKEFIRPINANQIVQDIKSFLLTHANESKKRILVVDDDGTALRAIKGFLGTKYQVILANSGVMAIKYLTMDKPDLIILDYEMPIVDGPKVLEMIRSEMDFSDIPVIFLTSKGDKQSIMRVMHLRPEGYLLKSMEPKMIVASIDDFFAKKKASI